MEKNVLELSDELLKEILQRDPELQVLFIRSLKKAFEHDRINFTIKMSASDLLRSVYYITLKEINKGLEKIITKKLMEVIQKQTS